MSQTRDNVVELPSRPRWDYTLVPDDKYSARVIDAETWARIRGWDPRVAVWWMLCDPGYMETVIPAWYRVRSLSGRAGRRGRFRMRPRSRLAMDLAAMLGERMPEIATFPIEDVCDRLYRVRTRTVTQTAEPERRELPEPMRYSVIDHVLGGVE